MADAKKGNDFAYLKSWKTWVVLALVLVLAYSVFNWDKVRSKMQAYYFKMGLNAGGDAANKPAKDTTTKEAGE